MITKPLADCRLYTFVDAAYLDGRSPQDLCRQLCLGGSDLIQWRAKSWPRDKVTEVAQQLRAITAGEGVGLVINDYPDVAAECGADFCHLGQEDFFHAGLQHVSQIAPAPLHVGLSTHAPAQAERAAAAGAAYLAVGPVFATPTKPTAAPVTLQYVHWAATHLTVPWFGIGGIHLGNLDEVIAAGAQRICVVSAILNASNPAEACQQFKNRLASSIHEGS